MAKRPLSMRERRDRAVQAEINGMYATKNVRHASYAVYEVSNFHSAVRQTKAFQRYINFMLKAHDNGDLNAQTAINQLRVASAWMPEGPAKEVAVSTFMDLTKKAVKDGLYAGHVAVDNFLWVAERIQDTAHTDRFVRKVARFAREQEKVEHLVNFGDKISRLASSARSAATQRAVMGQISRMVKNVYARSDASDNREAQALKDAFQLAQRISRYEDDIVAVSKKISGPDNVCVVFKAAAEKRADGQPMIAIGHMTLPLDKMWARVTETYPNRSNELRKQYGAFLAPFFPKGKAPGFKPVAAARSVTRARPVHDEWEYEWLV